MIDGRVQCNCHLVFELQSLRVFEKRSNNLDYNETCTLNQWEFYGPLLVSVNTGLFYM